MIFIDSNVFIYAVGKPHPLKDSAREFFLESRNQGKRLVTSSEVLQELMHVYLPVDRIKELDAALDLASNGTDKIFPIQLETIQNARFLVDQYPELSARDLIHLAVCHQYKIRELKSFDRALTAAFMRKIKK